MCQLPIPRVESDDDHPTPVKPPGAAFLHLSESPSEIENAPVRKGSPLDIPAELLKPGQYCKVYSVRWVSMLCEHGPRERRLV